MRIVERPDDLAGRPLVAASIGDFDGVHLGHQWLLRQMVALARGQGVIATAITFRPHPQVVLRPSEPVCLLAGHEEKIFLLAQLGIDLLLVYAFTPEFSHLTADQFFARLSQAVQLRHLVVGPDFALGHRREGTESVVREIGPRRGFELHVVPPFVIDGQEIRSSEVRRLIQAGDVEQASTLIGRLPTLYGMVEEGDGRGRTLGFPTANLRLLEPLAVPAHGVYACWAELEPFTPRACRWPAAVNIGVRPTFRGARRVIEAHLLGFRADVYGQQLRLHFQTRLRPEQRFGGPEELIAQIRRDVERTRAVICAADGEHAAAADG